MVVRQIHITAPSNNNCNDLASELDACRVNVLREAASSAVLIVAPNHDLDHCGYHDNGLLFLGSLSGLTSS